MGGLQVLVRWTTSTTKPSGENRRPARSIENAIEWRSGEEIDYAGYRYWSEEGMARRAETHEMRECAVARHPGKMAGTRRRGRAGETHVLREEEMVTTREVHTGGSRSKHGS